MFTPDSDEGYRELLPGVRIKTLAYGDRTHLIRVLFEKGAALPDHHHPHEQTGTLISGSLEFVIDGDTIHAKPGDSWSIAGDVPHSAVALEESVAYEVFSPVREDYLL